MTHNSIKNLIHLTQASKDNCANKIETFIKDEEQRNKILNNDFDYEDKNYDLFLAWRNQGIIMTCKKVIEYLKEIEND